MVEIENRWQLMVGEEGESERAESGYREGLEVIGQRMPIVPTPDGGVAMEAEDGTSDDDGVVEQHDEV